MPPEIRPVRPLDCSPKSVRSRSIESSLGHAHERECHGAGRDEAGGDREPAQREAGARPGGPSPAISAAKLVCENVNVRATRSNAGHHRAGDRLTRRAAPGDPGAERRRSRAPDSGRARSGRGRPSSTRKYRWSWFASWRSLLRKQVAGHVLPQRERGEDRADDDERGEDLPDAASDASAGRGAGRGARRTASGRRPRSRSRSADPRSTRCRARRRPATRRARRRATARRATRPSAASSSVWSSAARPRQTSHAPAQPAARDHAVERDQEEVRLVAHLHRQAQRQHGEGGDRERGRVADEGRRGRAQGHRAEDHGQDDRRRLRAQVLEALLLPDLADDQPDGRGQADAESPRSGRAGRAGRRPAPAPAQATSATIT